MHWRKWFEIHGEYQVNPAITVDTLYEHFRNRLLDELTVLHDGDGVPLEKLVAPTLPASKGSSGHE